MHDNSKAFVTAVCGDLMLAKECVADLKTAGFGGEISVEPIDAADALRGGFFQAYGSSLGGAAGRGAILGGLVGAIIGCLLATNLAAEPAYVGLAGALVGTVLGISLSSTSANAQRLSKGNPNDRFLLRYAGTDDQVTAAYAKLTIGPCHNVLLRTHATN